MARVTYGPSGLRDLARRIVDPRPIQGWWWVVVLLLFPALTLLAAGVATLTGVSTEVRPFRAALEVAAAVAVVLFWGGATLRRAPEGSTLRPETGSTTFGKENGCP